jgi:ankyrin repeat protein
MLESFNRTAEAPKADCCEEIGDFLLKPLRLCCGKSVTINDNLRYLNEEQVGVVKKCASIVFYALFFPVTGTLSLVGVIFTLFSKTYSEAQEKSIGAVSEVFKILTQENISEEETNALKIIFNEKTSPNIQDNHGFTPLYHAVKGNHAEMVTLLINSGASFDLKDSTGYNPLYYFISKNTEIQEILRCRLTPLHIAAKDGCSEAVQMLVDSGTDVNIQDRLQLTPLHYAAENGHTEIVEKLIEKGATIDAQDKYGLTPLYKAAKNGHTEIVEKLIKNGATIDVKTKYGETLIGIATKNSHVETVNTLLDTVKDPYTILAALCTAAGNGHLELVKIFVTLRENLNMQDFEHDRLFPQCSAARNGNTEIIKILINENNVNTTDAEYTPLHYAVQSGHLEAVEMLIGMGAEVSNKSPLRECSPLSSAVESGNVEMVDMLLNAGADPAVVLVTTEHPVDSAYYDITALDYTGLLPPDKAIEIYNKLVSKLPPTDEPREVFFIRDNNSLRPYGTYTHDKRAAFSPISS